MIKFREILKGTIFEDRINLLIEDSKNKWLRDLGKNDIIHSNNVENNLDRLVPDYIKTNGNILDKSEIFLLLYAVYLHDIGRSDDEIHHEKRAYDKIMSSPETYKLNNKFEASSVAEICYGHAKEAEKPIKSINSNYGIAELCDRPLDLQFLAALLRLADEVDNAYTRVQGVKNQKGSVRNLIRFIKFDTSRWIIEFQNEPVTWKDWNELNRIQQYTQTRLDEIKIILQSKGLLYHQILLEPKNFSKNQTPIPKDVESEKLRQSVANLLNKPILNKECCGYTIDIYYEEKIRSQIYRNAVFVNTEIDEDLIYEYKEIFRILKKEKEEIEQGFVVLGKINEKIFNIAKTENIKIITIDELMLNSVESSDSSKIKSTTCPNGDPVKVHAESSEWEWDIEAAMNKSGYPHFMLKEIHEQVLAVHDTMIGRINNLSWNVVLDEVTLFKEEIPKLERIIILASGSSYNAGLFGMYLFERIAGIHTDVYVGSEFMYVSNVLGKSTLVIAISQSGETADTIAAVRKAKICGCMTLGITNVEGSSLSDIANNVFYTRSGPEIGVAATKTFTTQLVALYLLAIYFARKSLEINRQRRLLASLKQLPGMIQQVLNSKELIKEQAIKFSDARDYFFLGRSLNYPIALEGAMKMKEISYMHAEGYAAGELKHGPLVLITEDTPVVALATKSSVYDRMLNNIKEVKMRSAPVLAIADMDDADIDKYVDAVIRVPVTDELIYPVLSTVVLQLLAYYTANASNCPIDKARNIAKSQNNE